MEIGLLYVRFSSQSTCKEALKITHLDQNVDEAGDTGGLLP